MDKESRVYLKLYPGGVRPSSKKGGRTVVKSLFVQPACPAGKQEYRRERGQLLLWSRMSHVLEMSLVVELKVLNDRHTNNGTREEAAQRERERNVKGISPHI